MHGGTVKLENCSLSNSISSRGLSVEGPESSAILIDCKIKNCATAAICVLSAAKIKILGGTFSDCKSAEGQGMCVQGGGTKAEIFDACFARWLWLHLFIILMSSLSSFPAYYSALMLLLVKIMQHQLILQMYRVVFCCIDWSHSHAIQLSNYRVSYNAGASRNYFNTNYSNETQ